MVRLLVRNYTTQLEKVRLFDEYVNIRSQELIHQNTYLLEHEDVKRFVWWSEDFKETLKRVHRQANNHDASDFKDSELLLQDFLRRYTDPSKKFPLERDDGQVMLN
jgi:hypothetical protein